jgi:hypothetical protein
VAVGFGGLAQFAAGECGPITFEQYAAGTSITTQYAGVTFSIVNSQCAAQPVIRIAPAAGTVSPTRVLTNPNGCADVNTEKIVMTFEELQTEVSFAMGYNMNSAITVRSLNDGGVELQSFSINPGPTNGVFRQVRFAGSGANRVRRVEIGPFSAFNNAYVDDLRFSMSGRPQAEISEPLDGACLCGPIVDVRGIACDENDNYVRDRLEFQPYPSPPGAAWTPIGEAASPLCAEGVLYNWNIPGLAEGTYKLLLTVETDCGYSTSAVAVVHVDRSFDTLEIRQPSNAFTYGGTVCFDGTADDECFDSYELEWSLAGSGVFAAIDPPNSPYETPVINDPLGAWDTAGRADGDYTVRLTGTTTCGNSRSVTRSIRLDNTAPIAEISSPTYCSYVNSEGNVQVRGRVNDASLTGWVLQYSQVGTGTWVTIATGATNLPANSLIANWNTSGLPHCAYMLRLVVNTNTRVNCDDDPQSAIDQVAVNIGCEEDINSDGVIDLGDLTILLSAFGALCP